MRENKFEKSHFHILQSESLIPKYEYVTFQTYFLSLLMKEKDEKDNTYNSHVPF